MKIRCISQSIRLRLRKSDIAILKEHNCVKETVTMPGGTLVYELMIRQLDEPLVRFSNGRLTIQIPKLAADDWMNSKRVALDYLVKVKGAEELSILIEKDFPCKDRTEDQSDMFYELDDSDSPAC